MSDFKPRNLLLVLALVLALSLLVTIGLRYRPDRSLQTMVEALPKGIDVSLQDIDYTHIEDGRPRWRLVAEQVERQAGTGSLGVAGPRMSFYDDHGDLAGSLRADHGEVSDDYSIVRLRGEVVLKSSTGYTLLTDRLDYDQATQTATTDALVRLVGEGLDLEGLGMVFDARRERLLLSENVHGILDPAMLK